MLSYLVAYGCVKRLIRVENKDDLLPEIRRSFTVSATERLRVLLLVEDFDEYVDYDVDDLPNKGKLQIERASSADAEPEEFAGGSLCSSGPSQLPGSSAEPTVTTDDISCER